MKRKEKLEFFGSPARLIGFSRMTALFEGNLQFYKKNMTHFIKTHYNQNNQRMSQKCD